MSFVQESVRHDRIGDAVEFLTKTENRGLLPYSYEQVAGKYKEFKKAYRNAHFGPKMYKIALLTLIGQWMETHHVDLFKQDDYVISKSAKADEKLKSAFTLVRHFWLQSNKMLDLQFVVVYCSHIY